MDISGLIIVNKRQQRFLTEAMPNAPVVDDGRAPEAQRRRLRRSLARTFRRTADRLEAKPRWANKKRLALLLRQQLDDGSRCRDRGGNAGECRHGRTDSLSRIPKSNGQCVGECWQGAHQHGRQQ